MNELSSNDSISNSFIHSFIHKNSNSPIHPKIHSSNDSPIHSFSFSSLISQFHHSIHSTYFASLPKIGIDPYPPQSAASTPADPQTKTRSTPNCRASLAPPFQAAPRDPVSPFDPPAPTDRVSQIARFDRFSQCVQIAPIAPIAPAATHSAKTAAASKSRAFRTPTPGSFASRATSPIDRSTADSWAFHSLRAPAEPQHSRGVSPNLQHRGNSPSLPSLMTEFPAFFGSIPLGIRSETATNLCDCQTRLLREIRSIHAE